MNRLNALIAALCPGGVEYKPLEQCCSILDNRRKPITKSARIKGEYPYYGANGIQDYVSDYIFDGDYVLVGEDGSVITTNGNPVVNWAKGKMWVNNHAHIIEGKEGVLLRYLFHYIQTINVSALIHGNIPKLTGGDFRKLSIPLPPLPIQQEIVRILDKFTALEAELEAELEARMKQYEYYRNHLFAYRDDLPVIELGEVAQYSKARINATDLNSDNYVGVDNLLPNKRGKTKSSYVPENGMCTRYQEGDILIGNIRPYLKKIWRASNIGGTNGDVLVINITDNSVLSEYLYHLLSSDLFFSYNMQYAKGTKMPRGSKEAIMKYKIPIPPLAEQERIVAILDRFDTLVNDITQGLPAEIAARRKQYEYYRNKLLTFKEKVS